MSRWITIFKKPRLFEPLEIKFDGDIFHYKLDKQETRLDIPTLVGYEASNGNYYIYFEEWFSKGKLHREDGPAIINYDDPEEQKYYYNGKLSRLDGPAYKFWVAGYYHTKWAIDGRIYTEEEYYKTIDCTKKIIRRWRTWRHPKIVRCWRWMRSIDGQVFFDAQKYAGVKDRKELNDLIIEK